MVIQQQPAAMSIVSEGLITSQERLDSRLFRLVIWTFILEYVILTVPYRAIVAWATVSLVVYVSQSN